ncbi:MAG: peptidylprolyl isomerase [Halodesulfurarchaeum sp.]
MSDEQGTEEAEDGTSEDVTAEEESGVERGDFVRLEYTARTVEAGDLVDTTDRDVAEEENVETEGRDFSPRIVVLGEGHLFEPVEADIVGKSVGDGGSVVVPAVEAFGEYDEEEVRTVSAEKIPEDDRRPGAHVDIDGEHGHVETIIGGRARVDFNHPLAGEDIEYDYEIVETVTDRVEQANGLLQMYFDVDLDMHIETDEVEEEVEVEPEVDEAVEEEEEAEEVGESGEEEEPDEDEEPGEEKESGEEGEPGEEEETGPGTEIQVVEKETLYIESSPQLQFNQQWMMSKQQILRDVMEKIDVDRVIVQEIIEGAGGIPGMPGAGGGLGDVEAALEDADVDADEILDDIEDEDIGDLDLGDATEE